MLRLSTRHLALYRAAVAPAPIARQAWQIWTSQTALREADGQESQVLPILAQRIDILAPDEPSAQRLRGLRRHAAVRHHALAEEASAAGAVLAEQGIPTVAIKGLALAQLRRTTSRSIGDVDLLVPARHRAAAIAALIDASFEPAFGLRADQSDAWAERYHALAFRRPGKLDVDLHWRLSHQPQHAEAWTGPIFDRQQPVEGRSWFVPCPSHQLAVTIAHGWPGTSDALLRTLVDIAGLLREPDIDAATVDELTGRHALRGALRSVLTILADDGVDGAAPLLAAMPRVRTGDRLMAVILKDDRESAAIRLGTALAQRRPGALRRPSVLPLPASVGPTFSVDGAAAQLSLAGHGWWLGDGYATWTRRRAAHLQADVPRGVELVAEVIAAPGRAHRRVLVGCNRRWRLHKVDDRPQQIIIRPAFDGRRDSNPASATQPTSRPIQRVTIRIGTLRLIRPHDVLGNGDQRRIGVGVLRLRTTAPP